MMKHPAVYFGTDCLYDSYGITAYPGVDTRSKELMWATWYGMYPRILRKFVHEMGVITIEEAIRKMTSASANRLGLMDRGLIRPGMWADIAIFDPLNIREQDRNYPEGLPFVLVNGVITVDKGEYTGVRAGKTLKHIF